ncbi:MAG: alanine racemase [Oscillospiraceae bacterium]|jgi:alanine racemase|nr:alanine racemase [Oscillospiraceae bacterium]
MKDFFQRAWLEIHLDALTNNFALLDSISAPDCKVMAVVKADAYGHGVAETVRELASCGCAWFAVSNLEEALQVRAVLPAVDILILGYTPARYAQVLAEHNITQAVLDSANAVALSEVAASCGVRVRVHIKIDTGMSRLGFFFQDRKRDNAVLDDIAAVYALPGVIPEGIFTHFAQADDPANGQEFTELQFALFTACIDELRSRGAVFKLRHCCNSAAALLYPHMHMDIIRPGLVLYGIPADEAFPHVGELLPAMEMKTVLSQVKPLPEGAPVSYGSTVAAHSGTLSATVPVGYADGYPRALSGNGHMLLDGKRVPILGCVCMDQCVLDVSAVPSAIPGMTVTVFGCDGEAMITAQSLTEAVGAIPYELLCSINKRVPRVYLRNGELVSVANYMLFDSHGVRIG